MNFNNFKGEAQPLESIDISRIAYQIDVGEDELHAFMDVEAAGSGFDTKGRPKMLFEPHRFYKLLDGEQLEDAIDAGLAYRQWGEKPYPKDSYPRLAKAMRINPTAALMASSWGLTQILGENHKMVGFDTVEDMVRSFMRDEENHLEAAVDFIVEAGIDDDLRRLAKLDRLTTPDDCRPIVRVYNGSGYERNGYHIKFAERHNHWRGIKDSDFEPLKDMKPDDVSDVVLVGTVQNLLRELGYPEVGEVDNRFGNRTRNAILAFQSDHGLELTGLANRATLEALLGGQSRQESAERVSANKATLKKKGDAPTKGADWLVKIGGGILGASGLGGVVDGTASIKDITDGVNSMKELGDAIGGIAPWMLVAVVAGAAVFFGTRIIRSQVTAYREGRLL